MNFDIKKAEKSKQPLKLMLQGGSGAGKTMGALLIAFAIGKKIVMLDTEYGKGSLKSDMGDYDTIDIKAPYSPEKLISAINFIEDKGYDVCILDSASHFYDGEGGILEIAEDNGGFPKGWKLAGKKEGSYLSRIRDSRMHIISTVRMETENVIDNSGSKMKIVEHGMKIIQRSKTFPYVFDARIQINSQHHALVVRNELNMFPKEMEEEVFVIDDKTGGIALEW